MPVKKNKKARKRKSKTELSDIDRAIKKNIKNAAKEIPKMIIEDRKKQEQQENDPKPNYQYNYKEYRWKKMIMWFGVTILAGTVFFMWFLNTNATFFDINKNIDKSEEAKLLNESKNKIRNILSEVDIKEKLESVKIEDVKVNPPVTSTDQFEALIKSLNEMASSTQNITSSSTNMFTSSTINTASSTTNQ